MVQEDDKNGFTDWIKNMDTLERTIFFSCPFLVLLLLHLLLRLSKNHKKLKTIESATLATEREKSYLESYQENSKSHNDNNAVRPHLTGRRSAICFDKSHPKWWKNYHPNNIVSLDCEFVHLVNESGDGRIKLASVAVCDFLGNKVYEGKVYHHPGSFIVDMFTRSINGFEEDSFLNGKSLKEVQDEVKDVVLYDKLVIVFGGRLDFLCLNIDPSEIDVLDLQNVYYSTIENEDKETIRENHSLRSVYFYYFKRDIDDIIHTATTDAKAIMSIFKYGYIKQYKYGHKNWPHGHSRNDIQRL